MLLEKFKDPVLTAKGEKRASVELEGLKTLWFNTGTRCNLSCENCYIESNPKNDRLSFIMAKDVEPFLQEVRKDNLPTDEIGFTGGEPFLNPNMIEILEMTLKFDFKVLVLTNAYRLNRVKPDIARLSQEYGDRLVLRVSLDHYSSQVHEEERGLNTFVPTMENTKWLADNGVSFAIAGRSLTDESEPVVLSGYKKLFDEWKLPLDVNNKEHLVVFSEMDENKDVPEITTACWDILGKSPSDIMCSSSRMVVKRKGEAEPKVLACTLLAYDTEFELGTSLASAKKTVPLNHKYCAQFCVLGGSSCS